MSQAQATRAPAPPWTATAFHAVVGLVLFVLLATGAVLYGFLVLLPGLIKDQVELIYERYNTLLPDLTNPAMPVWVWTWVGSGVLAAVALSAGYLFLLAYGRKRGAALFWGWLGATAALVVPPVMALFLLPSVPKTPGGPLWWVLTGAGLAAGFCYVAWMYYRDSHGVGPLWASLLGLLRASTFSLLGFFFMLPAVREYKDVYSRSKVLVVFDVSGSMVYQTDDYPTENTPLDKLLTRQDKVMEFLADEKAKFLARLLEKNPVDAFRFARGVDPEFLHFSQDRRFWTRAEYDAWLKDSERDQHTPPPGDMPPEFWKAWLKPAVAVEASPEWTDNPDDPNSLPQRFRRLLDVNDTLLKDSDFVNNTNVGDSLLDLVDNEGKKMLQGVVVFTDGRSTESSPNAFDQLRDHAQAAHVPIFVVGIGEDRPQVRIDIADLRVPQQVQPDDKFPAVVELTGDGLPEQEAPVALELTYVHKAADGKEELLPIGLVESTERKPGEPAPDPSKLQSVVLGTKIVLHPTETPKFDKGSPPRVEVQFQIDAASLAAAAGIDLKGDDKLSGVKKWEIAETVPDAELRFRAVVPRAEKEIFAAKEHVSDPAGLIVQRKPLRVLLFASAATHEYQFVQALLVRDMTKGRVKVASFLQLPPGRTEPREGVLQDAPLLAKFPDQIDQKFSGEDQKQYDISEYDAIIAFDPDWGQLSDAQIQLIKQWADKGGGLIYVAGPVNTLELARPLAGPATERLKPILELLPVTLKDIRLEETNRDTAEAWPLDFAGATPDMEFLKLSEESAPDKPQPKFLDDWRDFFGAVQPDGSTYRGFFNFYPVDGAKPGAIVAARFADARAKLKDGTFMPYIVLSNPSDPDHRIVWLGWGEMWRLRQKNEIYLERFWTKLTRYAGGLNQGKVVKRITPNFGRLFTVGQQVVMEARIDDKGGKPLSDEARPKIQIKAPLVAPKLGDAEVRELESLSARSDLNPVERLRRDQLQRKKELDEQQKNDLLDLQKEKWMTPKPKSEGWFQVRFKPPVDGDYTMEVTVNETGDKLTHKFTVKPSNPEMDNTAPDFARMYETASYADEDVQSRIPSADYAAVLQKMQRPKLEGADQKEDRPRLFFDLKNADLIPKCMSETENRRTDYSDPRPIWDEPAPFRWMPLWAALLVAALLTVGFMAGYFLPRSDRPGVTSGPPAPVRALMSLFSVGGYAIGRNLGFGGWVLWVGGLVLLIAPLFLPPALQLGWYAFAALVGLMSMEWLIRKLLRLA